MPTSILEKLTKTKFLRESSVLIREIKTHINIQDFYIPLKIKIYLSDANKDLPYDYDVSAHVHTPLQAGPYYPSRTNYETEEWAMTAAIQDFTRFIERAVNEGHEPNDKWIIKNVDF